MIIFIQNTLLATIAATLLTMDIRMHSIFDLGKIVPLSIGVAICLSLWAVHSYRNHNHNIAYKAVGRNHSVLPALAVLGTFIISASLSISPLMSFAGTFKRCGGAVSQTIYVGLFLLIVRFTPFHRVRLYIDVLLGTGFVMAVYGICQHYGIDIKHWSTDFGYDGRVASTLGHPVFFSAAMVMLLPISLSAAVTDFRKYRKVVYLTIFITMLCAFFHAKTRGAFVGLVVSMIFYGWMVRRSLSKKTLLAGFVVVIGMGIWFNVGDGNTIVNRFRKDVAISPQEGSMRVAFSGTAATRAYQYKTAIKIIKDYPVLGIGPDTLGLVYPRYYAGHDGIPYEDQNRIHNSLIHRWVEVGLCGLLAYIWFLVSLGRGVYRLRRTRHSRDMSLFEGHWLTISGISAGLVGYVVQNQFSFGHVPILMMFWVLAGLLVVMTPGRGSGWHLPGFNWHRFMAGRKSLIVTAVTLSLVVIMLSLCRYKADLCFEKGRRLLISDKAEEASKNYDKAIRYAPYSLEYREVGNCVNLAVLQTGILSGTATNSKARYHEAINRINTTKNLYPEAWRSRMQLGIAYDFLANRKNSLDIVAMTNYRKAIAIHPQRYILRDKLAHVLAKRGNYAEAIYHLQEAIRIKPGSVAAVKNIEEIKKERGY